MSAECALECGGMPPFYTAQTETTAVEVIHDLMHVSEFKSALYCLSNSVGLALMQPSVVYLSAVHQWPLSRYRFKTDRIKCEG